jgi:ABC-type antimicrobial peptide transport system permease subunit
MAKRDRMSPFVPWRHQTDRQAVRVFNLMMQVHQFEIITLGLKVLMGFIGTLTLGIGGAGLMNIMLVSVTQRTREIGVRMAMGAQKSDVLWMVLGRGLRLTAIGVAIGLALSAMVTRFLGSFLYGLNPLDAVSFAGAALFWIGTAMLASYLPARRAARVDPVVALRWE